MISGDATFYYRCAMGIAIFTSLVLIWLSLGVGIIGSDGDRANILYIGVIALGFAGALMARFRSTGMARALAATAIAQALVAAFAVIAGLGSPWSGPLELTLLNGFFVALFSSSAWLFRQASAAQLTGARKHSTG